MKFFLKALYKGMYSWWRDKAAWKLLMYWAQNVWMSVRHHTRLFYIITYNLKLKKDYKGAEYANKIMNYQPSGISLTAIL